MSEKHDNVGPGLEFHSEWHREAQIDALHRALEAAEHRGAFGEDTGGEVKWIKNELARLEGGGQRSAEKRPRASAKKETR